MRKLLSLFVLLVIGLVMYGQDTFLFRNTLDDTANVNVDYSMASSHFLGNEVSYKMHLFKETYTYVEQGTPMSPGVKTIVRKPNIYYAVRKLNKYYKKQIRKDRIDETEARKRMVSILNKCFVIFDQDTTDFEDYLKSLKQPDDIEAAFDKIVLQ